MTTTDRPVVAQDDEPPGRRFPNPLPAAADAEPGGTRTPRRRGDLRIVPLLGGWGITSAESSDDGTLFLPGGIAELARRAGIIRTDELGGTYEPDRELRPALAAERIPPSGDLGVIAAPDDEPVARWVTMTDEPDRAAEGYQDGCRTGFGNGYRANPRTGTIFLRDYQFPDSAEPDSDYGDLIYRAAFRRGYSDGVADGRVAAEL